MAYVYRHIRLDKNEPFYIGIGSDSEGKYKRAKERTNRRNEIWKKIASKTEYKVQILFDNLSWGEACEKEIELISLYGRIDLNKGTLCNMTDGGDGTLGFIKSDETRKKISNGNKGKISHRKGKKHTEESRKKMSDSHKGITSCRNGKVHSVEAIKKMSESKKRLFESGYINPNSKEVINTETGEKYISAADCARKTGYKKLAEKLSGARKNNTPFQYIV